MRNVLGVGTLALFMIVSPSRTIAEVDTETLRHITDAVREMCMHPDRRGEFLRVEGEADAGILLKIVGANLSGTMEYEKWEGINQRLDQDEISPRECAVQVLDIIVSNFKPRTSSIKEVQELLEKIIYEFNKDHVEISRFTNYLALDIKEQQNSIFPALQAAGDLKELRWHESQENENGKRIYYFIAYHEKASFGWTISTNDNAIVDVLVVQRL